MRMDRLDYDRVARVAAIDTGLPFDLLLLAGDKVGGSAPIVYVETEIGVIEYPIEGQVTPLMELQEVDAFVRQHHDVLLDHWQGKITDRQALCLLSNEV